MRHLKFFHSTLVVVLSLILSANTFAGNKDGKEDPQDYTSIAQINSTAEGKTISYTNPYTNNSASHFAGLFDGTLNGHAEKFYCIDLQHGLAFDQDYWDEGTTPSEITYVLNNYYPFKDGYSGQLGDNEEAAAVQFAIWHFSDGVDAGTISNNNTVKNRALAIISDANANHGNVTPIPTLEIIPDAYSWAKNSTATFIVKVVDGNNNPVSNLDVTLSSSGGTLSTTNVTTDGFGEAGPVLLDYFNYVGDVTITAMADVEIPQGTRYVHKYNPNDKQKLVLATPTFDTKQTEVTIEFYDETPPDEKFLCVLDKQGNQVTIGKITTSVLANGDVYARLAIAKSFNDNTYGDNAIGWPGDNHDFNHLKSSDEAVFSFKNGNNNQVLLFTLDYLEDGQSTSSGYGARIKDGNSPYILDFNTSLSRNFNDFGYVLTQDSPPTDNDYTPNPSYPNWTFDMVYEVTIDGDAFGASGFGSVEIPEMHNSPNKLGLDNKQEPFYCEPVECDGEIGDRVWLDFSGEGSANNCNGIQDAGEPGIAGVTVYLKDAQGNIIATTTTDQNGNYLFTIADLCNDTEQCAECDGKVTNLTLEYLGNTSNAHIVVKQKNGDKVFDGTVQPGGQFSFVGTDKGTLGTEISVYVNGELNAKIHTSCSQPIGPGLVKGDFLVVAGSSKNGGTLCPIDGGGFFEKCFTVEVDESTLPAGYTATAVMVGNDDTVDSNPNPADVCLSSSKLIDHSIDFGYCPPEACEGEVGDFIWEDADCDGIQDQGEAGIPNVTVILKDATGNVIETTVTDANGKYLFQFEIDCKAGCYFVEVDESTLPEGYSATAIGAGSDDAKDSNQMPAQVCLSEADNVDYTIDFGYCPPPPCESSIGDFIWHDKDVDGKQDAGEPGIPGVVVELYDADNNLLSTTTTDQNGHYEFAGLANGTYKVKVASSNYGSSGVLESTAQTKWYATKKNQGDDTKDSDAGKNESVTVTLDCNDNPTIDFGFYKTCVTLTKTGPQTAKPGDVITYTFTIENCGDITLSGGVDVYDALLNPSGDHKIKNITPVYAGQTKSFTKTYTVTENDCGELVNVATAVGHPINGSEDVTDEDTWTVMVDCDEPCTGEIGDYVFVDKTGDCNGGQQGSLPIEGAVVKLTYTENNQTITKTATTNAQGKYLFNELCANDYTVEIVSVPSQYAAYTLSTPGSFNVTLNTDDQKYYDADFGYCEPPEDNCEGFNVTFDGFVNNNDGTSTWTYTVTGVGADHDLSHWVLALCEDNVVSATPDPWEVVTDPTTGLFGIKWDVPVGKNGGQVTFSVTLDGQFAAVETDLAIKAGQDIIYCTTVGPECEEECTGEIGDYVFVDMTEDCNGGQSGSIPIEGAVVKLTYTEGNTTITKYDTTNANGKYLFDGLCADDYTAAIISLPAGYENYSPSTPESYNVTLTSDDQKFLAADFGYCEGPCVGDGKIGDFVWLDFTVEGANTNCNGIQDDGEPGIEGVKVILKDAQGNKIAHTFTDENGYYLFEDLCTEDACYFVFFDQSTLPAGTTPTAADQGNDDAKDSEINGVEVCLSENHTEDLTIDFGFCTDGCGGCEEACIGDFVWFDENENGIQDANELGVEGVTVELYNENGMKIVTDETDEDGFYRFTNLIPGYYYVKFVLPQGYVFTSKDQGSDDELDSDAGANGRTVTTLFFAGECDLSWDAGLVPTPPNPSCLGDRVWFDKDHDGIQDVNEKGVKDVTVKLYDGSNNLLETTVTDQFGYYKFNNLSAGTYKIKFELPSGYEFTLLNQGSDEELDSDAGNDGFTSTITLGVGECQLYWDAGLYAELPDLSLNKTVDDPNPEEGQQIVFTITVTNDGPGNATGVEVTDYMPQEGLTYNSYNASQGSFNPGSGVWSVGSLAEGQSATLELYFTVDEWSGGMEFEEFDLGIASDYNVFVLCSVNLPSSDVECKMAVGWDAYLSYYSVGDKLQTSYGEEDALVVGRNLTFTSGAVYGGNVVYGISTNLPTNSVSITGGSLIQDPNRIDFEAACIYLKNLSSQLAAYTVNGTTTYQWGGLYLEGTDPLLNVFHVSGADLTNAHTVSIDVPNGSVVVVNIDGDNIEWTGGLIVNGTSVNNVLYNFYEATFITIQGIDIKGSILAPQATVDFVSGVQHGQMIAKYLIGRGQYNCEPFLGNIPKRPNITNTAEITHVDQNDPDSTPGNGIPSEDDYAAATVYFSDGNNGGGGNGGYGDWEQIGNFDIDEVIWSIANDVQGNLLVGTAGGNLYKSTDGGSTWTIINSTMNVGFIWSIAVQSNGTIFVGAEQGVFYSSNNGASWSGPAGGLAYDVRAVAIDQNNGHIFAGTWGFGVMKSTNNGASFVPVNTGLGSLVVNSLAIDASGRIYAGTFGGGIFISTDGGANWTASGLSVNLIWAVDVTSTGDVYAATYGYGVFKSTDFGATWTDVNGGLQAAHIYGVAVNADDEVYVSTWTGGVYKLAYTGNGNGNNPTSMIWESVGMNGVGINALMVDKTNSTVYAGGSNGAIFKKREDGVTDVTEESDVPTEFKLSQNYPNPFNPTTAIEFAIREAGDYKLTIYNLIGEEVAVLVNGNLSPGYHRAIFDANNMASGIYFYKLIGSKVNLTRKMILLK